MPDDLDRLFDYLVRTYALPGDLIDLELSASAREGADDLARQRSQTIERHNGQAHHLREPFKVGLTTAFRLEQEGGEELRLSDRDPAENTIADALIRYLVRCDLARTRTEERGPQHYVYYLSVEWERLTEVARRAGIDLDGAIRFADRHDILPTT